jgi:hypothetical protein
MKTIVNLQNYYLPTQLEIELASFVQYYNHERYHESLDNLTQTDVYFGRAKDVLTRRDHIKSKDEPCSKGGCTTCNRPQYNLHILGNHTLANGPMCLTQML